MLAMVEMLLLRLNVICIHQILTSIFITGLRLLVEGTTLPKEIWTESAEWTVMLELQEWQLINSKLGLNNNTAPPQKRWGENIVSSYKT